MNCENKLIKSDINVTNSYIFTYNRQTAIMPQLINDKMKKVKKVQEVENQELSLSSKILDVKTFEQGMINLIRFNNACDLIKAKKLGLTIMLALLLSFSYSVQAQISGWYVCSSECYIHSNMGTPFTVIGTIKKGEGVNGLMMGSSTASNTLITVLGIDSAINIYGIYDIYYQISISKNNKIITIPANETIDEEVQRILNETEIRNNFNYKEATRNGLNGWVLKEKLMSYNEYVTFLNNKLEIIKANDHKKHIENAIKLLLGYTNTESKKVLKESGYTDADIKEIILNR